MEISLNWTLFFSSLFAAILGLTVNHFFGIDVAIILMLAGITGELSLIRQYIKLR